MSVNSFEETNTRPLISLWLPLSNRLCSHRKPCDSPPPPKKKRLKKLSDPPPLGARCLIWNFSRQETGQEGNQRSEHVFRFFFLLSLFFFFCFELDKRPCNSHVRQEVCVSRHLAQGALRCFRTTYFLTWSFPPQFYDRLALKIGKNHIGERI